MNETRLSLVVRNQCGATAVEFALILWLVLVPLLLATFELGRALYTWNSAVDATRRGARTAAILAPGNKNAISRYMCQPASPEGACLSLPGLTLDTVSDHVTIEYSADGLNFTGTCSDCVFVRVGLVNYIFHSVVFFLPAEIPVPDFSTTLTVEALGNTG